jgi:hypothetical protein
VQVWDFSRSGASSSADCIVSLTDDCAPIQYFKTGGITGNIRLYLPASYPEGKLIKIINAKLGANDQSIVMYSSDARGNTFGESGTNISIYTARSGNIFELFYIKANLLASTQSFTAATGWICTTQGSANSANVNAFGIAGGSATGVNAFAAGLSNTASGSYSVAMAGQSVQSIGQNSLAIGSGAISSGDTSVALGSGAFANSQYAIAIGRFNSTRSIIGYTVVNNGGAPISTSNGVTQASVLILGKETTDATTSVITCNGLATSSNNQLTLPNNSAYYVRGSCIATVTGGGNTKAWSFEAVIKRGANAAATSIVGAVIKNIVAADAGAAAWDITISADTTNGALAVSVTGAAATTIRWVCRLDSTEVTF